MQVQCTLSPEQRAKLQMQCKLNEEERGELAALACGSGKLECLKVLRNQFILPNGYPGIEDTWRAAAAAGHLDILQWLHEIRAGFCGFAASHAAHAGHLDCLSFLHSVDAYWDEFHAMTTAKRGQLACLAFMVEHGCHLFPPHLRGCGGKRPHRLPAVPARARLPVGCAYHQGGSGRRPSRVPDVRSEAGLPRGR
jgi:hypothetical protein